MFLIILSTLPSSGSSGVGEEVSALVNWGCDEGSGALPVRRASGVSEGGTDGLAGDDNEPLEWPPCPPRAKPGETPTIANIAAVRISLRILTLQSGSHPRRRCRRI